ncbi:acetylglutamate kinase [Bhargavaea cecembensis]|nr:acetylglutamate kinase [Bhargavaea cecembensis]
MTRYHCQGPGMPGLQPVGYVAIPMIPVPMPGTGNFISAEAAKLKADMRVLWEQHIAWTRMTIISLVFDLPDTEFVITRLLRNAEDMGNALRPYYGDRNADRYAELIKEHLTIAASLVKAAKAGETEKAEQIERDWYRNADEITDFLSSLNPYIDKEELRKMLYEHLSLTKLEAVCMIVKNFELEIEVFEQIETAALQMSDMISDAIIRQFGL